MLRKEKRRCRTRKPIRIPSWWRSFCLIIKVFTRTRTRYPPIVVSYSTLNRTRPTTAITITTLRPFYKSLLCHRRTRLNELTVKSSNPGIIGYGERRQDQVGAQICLTIYVLN